MPTDEHLFPTRAHYTETINGLRYSPVAYKVYPLRAGGFMILGTNREVIQWVERWEDFNPARYPLAPFNAPERQDVSAVVAKLRLGPKL